MTTNQVALLIGVIWVIGVFCLCCFVRGGAIRERELRETAEKRKRVADWIASKNLQ
nr:hypothetical protein [Paraburkholderia sp. BL8N3]